MSTLFERIGGAPAIDAGVDLFYVKVLADDRVKHFFEGIDMELQTAQQKRFITYAMGGAPGYPGRSMRDAHKRLVDEMGLNDGHFDAILENLGSALKELGVADDLITEAAGIVESTRADVLNK